LAGQKYFNYENIIKVKFLKIEKPMIQKVIITLVSEVKEEETKLESEFAVAKGYLVKIEGAYRVAYAGVVMDLLKELGIKVQDISQKRIENLWVLAFSVELTKSDISLNKLRKLILEKTSKMGVTVRIQDEAIFKSMHRV